jgi:WD40 repeat protein
MRPGEGAATSLGRLEWIQAICDRFEADWKGGGRPRIEDRLVDAAVPERASLLLELLAVELHWRRRAGERPAAHEYLERLPDDAEAVHAAFGQTGTLGLAADPPPAPHSTRETIVGPATTRADGSATDPPTWGTHIRDFGDYELIRELGRGGMGVVYQARQISLNRPVALKMIRSAALASEGELRRFQNEAEAVARLEHPNIVPIFEVGRHEDQPYFSMKLVAGGGLDGRLPEYLADPQRAAGLVAATAAAIHHAHQRGILHRDLKPGNILVDADGQPHVTDFGLAKRIEGDSELTQTGAVLGTPAYMSPEQASARLGEVTTATDIYGLGTILYALLTGRGPFGGTTALDTLDQVRHRAPETPRSLNPRVPRDLEVICLKCLQKDPARRYANALELAEDLTRFQAGRPIQARPVGWPERAWSWCRRNPALAASLAILAVSLIAGTAVSSVLAIAARAEARRAHESEWRAVEARRAALAQLVDLSAASGVAAARREDHAEALLWFTHAVRLAASDPERDRLNRIRVRNWDRRVLQPEHRLVLSEFRSQQDRILAFQFHASGRYLIALSTAGIGTLWDLERGAIVPIPDGPERLSAAAFSADGRWFALGTAEGRVEIRDFPALRPVAQWDSEHGRIRTVAFSPDGRRLAVGDGGGARVWDVEQRTFITPRLSHPAAVVAMSFNGRGDRLVTVADDQLARTFASSDDAGKPLYDPMPHTLGGFGVAHGGPDAVMPQFVERDTILLTVTNRKDLDWRDAATGRVLSTSPAPRGLNYVTSLTVSPDGRDVAVAWSGMARIFKILPEESASAETQARRIASVASSPREDIWNEHVAFSPGGDVLAVAGSDTLVRFWSSEETDDQAARPAYHPLRHPMTVVRVAFAPDGSRLAVVQWDGTVCIWRFPTAPPEDFHIPKPGPTRVALSPDGRHFLLSGVSYRGCTLVETRAHDAATGRLAGPPIHPGGVIVDAAFSPDGRHVAVASSAADTPGGRNRVQFKPEGRGGNLQVWDWSTGERIVTPIPMPTEPRGLGYSPDGRSVAVTCADGWVVLVDATRGAVVRTIDTTVRTRPYNANLWWSNGQARFSPDGRRLVTWEMTPKVHVWDPATGRKLADLPHDDRVETVAFGPDPDLMITCGRDFQVRVWDMRQGRLAAPPMRHPHIVTVARFTPDGTHVESAGEDGTFRVWDWRANRLVTGQPLSDRNLNDFGLTLDRRWLVATGIGRTWLADARTGLPVSPPLYGGPAVNLRVTIPPDGRRAIVSGFGEDVVGYNLPSLLTPAEAGVEELISRAELVSCRRVQEDLALIPLTPADWADRWQAFLQTR